MRLRVGIKLKKDGDLMEKLLNPKLEINTKTILLKIILNMETKIQ
jgi:hypothetical protein